MDSVTLSGTLSYTAAPERTVLNTDGVLLGKYDIIGLPKKSVANRSAPQPLP